MKKFLLLCGLLLTITVAVLFFLKPAADRLLYPLEHRDLIEQYAKENSLSPQFICGVIYTESRFREEAVSYADAKGLMQITEDTFEWAAWRMGEEDASYENIFDPETNIKYGSYILRLLIDEFGSEETALAAYNAGWGNVKEWLSDPLYSRDGQTLHAIPFKDTENYVPNVQEATQKYKDIYFN